MMLCAHSLCGERETLRLRRASSPVSLSVHATYVRMYLCFCIVHMHETNLLTTNSNLLTTNSNEFKILNDNRGYEL